MDAPLPFPLSKTKLLPPQRRAELITRPRLIERLYELLNKKLTIISAPAGYGKTSLLIDLADQSEIPVCWLSLDSLDEEPQRFLTYLIACLREKFPSFGGEALTVLKNAASIERENERLAVSLTNAIFHEIHEHFVIVLDDYQFIDPVPEIRAFINRFVQLAGEHCHLVLATRLLPSLADLHLLVARDQVGGLSLEDLAFQPAEIQLLFAHNAAQNLSLEEAEALARKTDGWITSLSLTGLSYEKGRLQQKTPAARTGVDLYDYFAREVLEKQAPALREFLLLTSLFDEVDLEACQAVLKPLFPDHPADWKTHFNHVQKHNLFAIPVGLTGLAFRYHHLFQDFLQAKVQEENPALIPAVMTRLATFYTERQDWEKAHHIYESNNDLLALGSLIEQAGTYFIRNGRIATLGNWLDRLPVFMLQQSPRLLSLQGAVAHLRGETQKGIKLLTRAEQGFRLEQDPENLATTLVRRAVACREAGEYPQALADADEVIALTQDSRAPNLQYNLAAAMRIKGLALYRQGRTAEAPEWLENSLRVFRFLKASDYVPLVEMELGLINYLLGNHEAAIKFYRSASTTWEADGNLGWLATLLNNLGVLYHQRGEYENAFRTFEQAIESSGRSINARIQAVVQSSLGDLLVDLHEFAFAVDCYEQARARAIQQQYPFLAHYAAVARARVARLENQFALAETLLTEVVAQPPRPLSPADEALFRLEHGCLLLQQNQPLPALDELTRAVSQYEKDGLTQETSLGRLWLAAALLASGQVDPALTQLKAFLAAYSEMKEPAPLFIAAGEARRWLDPIKSAPGLSASLEKILARAEQFSRHLPALRRKLRQVSQSALISPPLLKIQAFGPAQAFLGEKKISLSDWQTRETRDLFFFFLQANPQAKEDLANIFWPDISPERLKMRFKTNIYRLRHAVGQNAILFEGERYRFNHEIDYEYDVEAFKKYLEQAEATTVTDESILLLRAAIDLVKGPYLSDVDADWAAAERTRLEFQYHAALLRLGELHLDAGQAAQALEICQIALKSDPLMEEAYRLSMRAYAQLGDRAAVARVYQTCAATLKAELGVKPSRETERLSQRLI